MTTEATEATIAALLEEAVAEAIKTRDKLARDLFAGEFKVQFCFVSSSYSSDRKEASRKRQPLGKWLGRLKDLQGKFRLQELSRKCRLEHRVGEDDGRGWLASAAVDTVPDGVNFLDWVSVLSILSGTTVTIDQLLSGRRGGWSYVIDEHGRITEVVVGREVFFMNNTTPELLVDATADAIAERDRLMKEVLIEMDSEKRGKFMTMCLKLCPKHTSFVDFVAFASSLSRAGIEIANLKKQKQALEERIIEKGHDKKEKYSGYTVRGKIWKYSTDKEQRITDLEISDWDQYDFPAGLGRLRKLNRILVRGLCRSLPAAEMSTLPHLQELSLVTCSILLRTFPLGMKTLPHLKKLSIINCQIGWASQFIEWMSSHLPVLEELDFRFPKQKRASVLKALRSLDFRCKYSMKSIVLKRCNLRDVDLATLLLKFPNLSNLDLARNGIKSVQPIIDMINTSGDCFLSKSIRKLNLEWNPILGNAKRDPNEKEALLSFLRVFNTIRTLYTPRFSCHRYHPDVEYALAINQAGRSIVQVRHHGKHTKAAATTGIVEVDDDDAHDRSLPLSVWPIVLERSYKKSDEIHGGKDMDDFWFDTRSDRECWEKNRKSATGLYYLVRNIVPSLIVVPSLLGRPSVSENKFDDNAEGEGGREHANSLKRKRSGAKTGRRLRMLAHAKLMAWTGEGNGGRNITNIAEKNRY